MGYNNYIFILLLVTTCALLYIAFLAWKKRDNAVAFCFFFGVCAGALYSFGYAFEIISTSLEQMKFWLKIEYIGLSFGTVIWFLTIVLYTNTRAFLRKWVMLLLGVVPVITFIGHYTNDWHHLFYRDTWITYTEGFPQFTMTIGPLYILHTVYSYLLVLIAMILLIRLYRRSKPHKKKQVMLLIIGSCVPYGITILYLSGKVPIDIGPIGFFFLGIFYFWGIYQYNLFKLVPHALNKVFETMKEAVIVIDQDSLVSSYNKASITMFKELEDKKVVGQSVFDVFSPYKELVSSLKQGDTQRKIQIDRESGLKHYHLYTSDIRDKKEHTIGTMLMFNDITEAVRAEEALRNHSKKLQELNAFKDKMFTVIAHDIRNPLTILMNLMDILLEEREHYQDNQKEIIDEMDKQIHNTFSLVESLLDWFRNQRSGMVVNPVDWNLALTIQGTLDLLQPKIKRKCIDVISEIEDDVVVYADKEMLDVIIRNLLTNAIKFTEYGGKITVMAKESDEKVIISVTDTGKGIDPIQAKLLLQENKLNPISNIGTDGERGIGIGLALCKEFVHYHEGELWFESIPNQGSTFSFSIPIRST